MIMNLEDMAYALYDGGWRSGDYEDLKREYELDEDEARDICDWLEEVEERMKEKAKEDE